MAFLNFELAQAFAQQIRQWNALGHSAATGTNYSFRNDANSLAISESGIDKSQFGPEHWLLCNEQGDLLPEYQTRKSSAETGLHLAIYQACPEVGAIVHSHSLSATLLSAQAQLAGYFAFQGYEVLKAFKGITTHETMLTLPVFPNNQDIPALAQSFLKAYARQPFPAYLIARHGFYTWGKDLAEAKRHFEALDFLLQAEIQARLIRK